MSDRPVLNDDFADLIGLLHENHVEFLIVGAHALAAHGVIRGTGDLDVLVQPTSDNGERVVAALLAFGAPLRAHGIQASDFATRGTVYQLGLPPRRIDILTEVSGLDYDQAADGAVEVEVQGARFRVPSRESLITNKRASARAKDLEDVRHLEALADDGSS